jgi:hypothetical protein
VTTDFPPVWSQEINCINQGILTLAPFGNLGLANYAVADSKPSNLDCKIKPIDFKLIALMYSINTTQKQMKKSVEHDVPDCNFACT